MTGRTQRRVAWPDLAKGVCVSLVVLWHVTSKSFSELPGTDAWTGMWLALSAVLTPFRIPLFFAISGYFASRALARPWSDVLRPRLLNPYYLYALWLVIHTAVFSVLQLRTNTARDPLELFVYLMTGASNLWYLYALAAYFLIARVAGLTRATAVVSVVLAAAVSVVAYAELIPAWGNSEGLLRNLVFFLVPAFVPDVLRRVSATASWRLFGLALGAFLGCAVLRLTLGPWAAVPAAVTGVWLGTVAAVIGARWGSLAWLVSIGRQTLPVYVMHLPLLALLHAVVVRQDTAALGPVLVFYPVAATAFLLATCLLLHRALVAARLGVLFSLPAKRPVANAGSQL